MNDVTNNEGVELPVTTPQSLKSSIVNTSLTSCTEALTNETTPMSSKAQEQGPSSIVQVPKVPQIVSFESPIKRQRQYSLHSNELDDGPDFCTTDIDFDTDMSGEFVDSDSTHSQTNSCLSCVNYLDQSNNDLHLGEEGPEIKCTAAPTIQNIIKKTPATSSTSHCFNRFRTQYLLVHTAIMLADGLQGTHLYVLYEGYGYSVASLYAIGFVSGAFTSPFIGPVVDKVGRKRAAIVYCLVEMLINSLEQYDNFLGLIFSRVLGGITTNLLFSVFESWLITEHRKRGFEEEKLEIILRDSTIVSNSAAIVSGYLAHCLAGAYGPVGPFEGAVTFTGVALGVVALLWTENYGKDVNSSTAELLTFRGNMVNAYRTIVASSHITRIGIIQGLTEGSLQTFVFLWAPALRAFASNSNDGAWGLGKDGEPSYGLIFGSFMFFGVAGGFLEPKVRKSINCILPCSKKSFHKEGAVDPISVHKLCILCYSVCALVLLTPCVLPEDSKNSFTLCFAAFLVYELMIGLYMPCEGVVRSIYMPNESICSLMTMLRVIVNVAVAGGVISTNYIPFTFAFGVLSVMMIASACLQLSLLTEHQQTRSEKKVT